VTHPSYRTEHPEAADYERLEFLGDAVVQLVVSEVLLARFPDWDEGALSKARAQLVDRRSCVRLAHALGLPAAMRAERGLVVGADSKIHANLFEAWVGAVYTDAGIEAARAMVAPLFEGAAAALSGDALRDPKSALQERCQGRGEPLPAYVYLGASGPDHARMHRVEVHVGGRVFGPVEARQKKVAEVEAARLAMGELGD
jgi:ribonuclease-3